MSGNRNSLGGYPGTYSCQWCEPGQKSTTAVTLPLILDETDFELEIKDTTDTDRSASYLDLHLEIDKQGG
jgi:hypothetical protein